MAKKALVIGISKFTQFADLHCDRDLERMSQWLRDQGYDVTVAPDRFDSNTLTTQPKPTGQLVHADLESVLGRFLTETVQGCEVAVVYIASHGYMKHKSFGQKSTHLVASNTCKDPIDKSIDLADLATLFKNAPVDNLVGIFDFCHAGAIDDQFVKELFQDIDASFRDASFRRKNYALLAACRSSEGARDTAQGGVFTTALIEGLQPDQADSEGEITAARLCDYVQKRLRQSGQTPRCWPGSDRLVLGRYDQATSQPTIDRSSSKDGLGRVLVAVRKAPQLKHYFLNAWVQKGEEHFQKLPPLDNTKTDDTVAYAWSKLGEWFADLKLRVAKYQNDKTTKPKWAKYQIDLFLPIDLLNLPIEQVTPESPYGYSYALGQEYPVVVRPAERLEQTYPYRGAWEEQWKKLEGVGKAYATEHLLLANCSSELNRLVKQGLMRPDVIGIRRSQPPETTGKGGFLGAILQAGLPVAVWVRQDVPGLDCAACTAELDRLLTCEIATLPNRIHEARWSEIPIAQHLSLLWDDPERVPPDCDAFLIS